MANRFDPKPPARSSDPDVTLAAEPQLEGGDDTGPPSDADLLAVIARAKEISRDYQTKTVDKPLGRAYRAWQNQHAENSKYMGAGFKGRSRLFVPKTRSAVRKNLAAAAGALFATRDVTAISATFEDDPQQKAIAATIKADLEYRLSHDNPRSGIPWFLMAMGACLDSQLTGVCISKQSWEYEEVDTGQDRVVEEPIVDPATGQPLINEYGELVMRQRFEPITRVTKDRPMVELHPIENVEVDPAAPWYAPAQLGRWFNCLYPMGLSDVRAMIASADKTGNNYWRPDITDATLRKGRLEDERNGNRRVREGGGDRYEDAARAGGGLDVVFLQENFVRIAGRDWHFWSIGRHAIISEVRETIEAYPEFGGTRPYVMGIAQLDTHRVFPQSPVETWQPLQLELNDITNLRIDTLKRSIAPLAKAKRGTQVDLQALQRRGQPETVLMVNSMTDIEFVNSPPPNGQAFQETSITNANFDELAGVFSTSSVQQSRQLNETVGGMAMMSRAAGSVSEFDLRVWIETWVEPVIRQLAHLVRYNESDEKIIAIAGQKARVWTRYQYMPSIDDFEQCELTVRVDAGTGAEDPAMKLQRLKVAMEMLAPLMPEAAKMGISLDIEEIIEEVMGGAGFRDGRRFFTFGEAPAQDGTPPPELIKIMKDFEAKMAKIQADTQKSLLDAQVKREKIASDERQSAADNDAAISSSEIEWTGRHGALAMELAADAQQIGTSGALRKQEMEATERYRMMQLGQRAQPEAATRDAGSLGGGAPPDGIAHVLEQVILAIADLRQEVASIKAGPSAPAATPLSSVPTP